MMPTIATHVQVSMPPIGSSGSGLASYKALIHPLKDEKKVTYMPLADIVYQSNCVVRSTIGIYHFGSIQNVIDFL